MREAVVHRTDVGKAASRVYDGKLGTGITLEEEQTGISFGWISFLFFFRVNVIKDGIPGFRMISHVVADLHRHIRINVVVPGKTKTPKCITAHISAVYRKEQPAVIAESRIVLNICDPVLLRIERGRSRADSHLIIIRIPEKQR